VTINITTSVRPSSTVMMRTIDDGGVLVDIDRGTCWELNIVGRWIWERLAALEPLSGISEALSEKYGISMGSARGDVLRLVGDLASAGLVVVGGSHD
jgi:hypothetical protein